MIDPQACAKRITRNDPSLAEPLLDILIWANQPNLADSNDYDEVLNLLYLKLDTCREARNKYLDGRIG